MKRFLVVLAAVLFAVTASAANAPAEPKVLQSKQGNVTFKHDTHKALDCTKCHASKEGGKIAGLTKDSAHALCKKCHETEKKGPTKCNECHKK
jgi:predicted CXXCH cytochrome family protein